MLYPTKPNTKIGIPNMAYIRKNNVPTEYKIAVTNAARLFFAIKPTRPKIAPIKNNIIRGVTNAVAIAPPRASAPPAFRVLLPKYVIKK